MIQNDHKNVVILAVLSSIMIISITLPFAWALEKRTDFSDTHSTARFKGGVKICGDHKCTGSDYAKMLNNIHQSQKTTTICKSLKDKKTCN